METIIDVSMTMKDMNSITEQIRIALKRTITRKFCEGGSMKVILSIWTQIWKRVLLRTLHREDQGMYLALSPDVMQSIVTQLGEELKKFTEFSQNPIVLISMRPVLT